MSFLQKIHPSWPLRLGLGFMYLYSGIDIIRHPSAWTWAIPPWFSDLVGVFMSIDTYMKIQGASEVLLAVVFLLWFLPRRMVLFAALISCVEIAGILLLAPLSQFLITFRDLGVLGASAALFLLSLKPYGSAAKQV
ncbi:MAG TPA: hypothetical protein VJC15_03635 [Candidatus Paceibacterota bacterium]